jgi:hypothetical protein
MHPTSLTWLLFMPKIEGRMAWPASLIIATALLPYISLLLTGSSFQFDDFNVIVNNPVVHDLAHWRADLTTGIRPLLKLTYTIDWQRGDGSPHVFHQTNLLIHAVNALLVWRLAHQFSRSTHQRPCHQIQSIALLSALIFALHPIHSEAVIYISGRSSALMAMFYLAGLCIYAHATTQTERPNAHPGLRYLSLHLLVPICFILALLTKETAITFPAALLLWDICLKRRIRDALPCQTLCWLLLGIGTLLVLGHNGYFAHLERSITANSLSGNLASLSLGTLWLLRQWLLPLWLNIDPDLPQLHEFNTASLFALSLLILFSIQAYRLRHRYPAVLFATGWLLLHLLSLHLLAPRLDIVNERQMLLAGWPLALLLATQLVTHLNATHLKRTATILLSIALILTAWRNLDYASEVSLWQSTAQNSPNKPRVFNNLGYALAQRNAPGDQTAAYAAYQHAMTLDPNFERARWNLHQLKASLSRQQVATTTGLVLDAGSSTKYNSVFVVPR